MAKPPGTLVVKWRDLAEDGLSYAEIARRYPDYSADQVRHYCMGTSGKKLPGPLQKAGRYTLVAQSELGAAGVKSTVSSNPVAWTSAVRRFSGTR